jgi:hypothetical protein
MARFTKKPVTIDAIQFTGDNLFDCLRFMGEKQEIIDNLELHATDAPIIHTPEGTMSTSIGDWIICGIKGEYYPCKPDIFAATYSEGERLPQEYPVTVLTVKGDIIDQPPPQRRDDLVPSWELVITEFREKYMTSEVSSDEMAVVRDVLDDMTARDSVGRERYGVPLTAHNGRDQLIDAYQEGLDFAVYLRSAMTEGLPVSGVYSNALHNIFWLRVAINGRAPMAA